MKNLQTLLTDVTKLTNTIETNYPELYKFLEENPITIPSINHPDINKNIMQDYLKSLKLLLEHHIKTHKNI